MNMRLLRLVEARVSWGLSQLKTGLSHTPSRAQGLQLLSLPGNSMGLACLEVSDVQLFPFLWEGVALLEDTTCISSGPEASLLPGPPGDTLAMGEMSPLRGTCESGLSVNMKSQVQASQGAPQPHSQGNRQVFLWQRPTEGRSSNQESEAWPPPAPQTTMWKLSVTHKGLRDTQDLCPKALAGRALALGPLTHKQHQRLRMWG